MIKGFIILSLHFNGKETKKATNNKEKLENAVQ